MKGINQLPNNIHIGHSARPQKLRHGAFLIASLCLLLPPEGCTAAGKFFSNSFGSVPFVILLMEETFLSLFRAAKVKKSASGCRLVSSECTGE
jgi:hypothetical protein